jgi:hypothetical protein
LFTVYEHREIERADCTDCSRDASANDSGHRWKHALRHVVAVFGCEREFIDTSANTYGVKQRIFRCP